MRLSAPQTRGAIATIGGVCIAQNLFFAVLYWYSWVMLDTAAACDDIRFALGCQSLLAILLILFTAGVVIGAWVDAACCALRSGLFACACAMQSAGAIAYVVVMVITGLSFYADTYLPTCSSPDIGLGSLGIDRLSQLYRSVFIIQSMLFLFYALCMANIVCHALGWSRLARKRHAVADASGSHLVHGNT